MKKLTVILTVFVCMLAFASCEDLNKRDAATENGTQISVSDNENAQTKHDDSPDISATQTNTAKTYTEEQNSVTIEVTKNSVAETGRDRFTLPVAISDADAITLSQIIDRTEWHELVTESERDCVFNLGGKITYYDSITGTLCVYDLSEMSVYSSKKQNIKGKSAVLTENDRTTVNSILEKYITLAGNVES